MSKKYMVAGFCLMLAAGCALFFSRTARSKQKEQTQQAQVKQEELNPVSDHIVYRMLLHHVYLHNQKAAKAERADQKDAARAYRAAFKSEAQLNDHQKRALDEIADECELAVRAIDAKAKLIIDARREHYRKTGDVLPPAEELRVLQAERNNTILRYRDQLHEALGEQEWLRFQAFVRQRVVPNIKTGAPGTQQTSRP